MLVVVVLVRDLLFRSTVLKSLSPLCWLCVMDDDVSADLVRFGHCSGRFLLGRLLWLSFGFGLLFWFEACWFGVPAGVRPLYGLWYG